MPGKGVSLKTALNKEKQPSLSVKQVCAALEECWEGNVVRQAIDMDSREVASEGRENPAEPSRRSGQTLHC
jgi:hypothetical protein